MRKTNLFYFTPSLERAVVGLLLMLCSMMTAWAEGADGFIEVSTPNGLKQAIQNDNAAQIKLTADIDISNIGTICDTFRGHIYGKYQYTNEAGELRDTVYSLSGGGKEIPRLFNKLDHANIEYVMLDNFSVNGTGDNVGGLASSASYTNFSYMMMNKVAVSSKDDNVGGLLGNADHCYFDCVTFNNSSVTSNETIVGGLVGESHQCTYSNSLNYRCSVFGDGALASNYARVGGFCGYSVGDTFTNCMNSSVVGGNEDSVGGFAGRSDGTNFLQCRNSGVIVHATEDEFKKVVESVKELYDKLYDPSYLDNIIVNAGFTAILTFMLPFSGGVMWLGSTSLAGTILGGVAVMGIFCASILVVGAIAAYFAWLSTLHDEIGGISGQANRGEFSLCTNSGYINCRDSQGGGIVGRAYAITVDNCLNDNKCEWGDDDCGGIIGEATGGCKVTNCLSIFNNPIIGAAKDMNTASSNNYCLAGSNTWQEKVDDEKLKTGRVAYWLNNGIENRDKGISPWHQTLGKDNHPVLDASHDAVSRDELFDITISSVEELKSFAKIVKFNGIYTNAKLLADLDMTNEEWEPIGDIDSGARYCGIFDGQGHTIKGLKYKGSVKPAGLFSCVGGHAEIRNVIIGAGSEFSNPNNGAGAIVGRVHHDSHSGIIVIENCGSLANVSATKHAGGILGRVSTGDDSERVRVYVNNCFSSGIITADDGNSGLISGYMKNHGYVSNCWSNAQLRIGQGYTTWPYGCEHEINECFVGYEDNLNISNCCIIDPEDMVDRYTEKKLQDGVTSLPATTIRSGELTFILNGGNNETSKEHIWQQDLHFNTTPMPGNKGVYYSHDIFESAYGTLCLPITVKSDDKVKFYRLVWVETNEDKIDLIFEPAEYLGAGVAGIYRSAVEESNHVFRDAAGFYFGAETRPYSVKGWYLKGTYTTLNFDKNAVKNIYGISATGNIKSSMKNVSPFNAYLEGPNIDDLSGKTINFVIEGEDGPATSLQLIGDDLVPVQKNGKTYSLMGTEVGNGYRGIVIQNGRKYIK